MWHFLVIYPRYHFAYRLTLKTSLRDAMKRMQWTKQYKEEKSNEKGSANGNKDEKCNEQNAVTHDTATQERNRTKRTYHYYTLFGKKRTAAAASECGHRCGRSRRVPGRWNVTSLFAPTMRRRKSMSPRIGQGTPAGPKDYLRTTY